MIDAKVSPSAAFMAALLLCTCGACASLGMKAADDHVGPAGKAGLTAAAAAALAREAPAVEIQEKGPLSLSVTEAILQGLQNNRSLRVERFKPAIRQTYEEQGLAAFDPELSGQLATGRTRAPAGTDQFRDSDTTGAEVSLDQRLPYGTTVGLGLSTDLKESPQSDVTRLGVTVTHPLLLGSGTEVNLASVRQAGIDTRVTEYELRGFAESLVTQIEETYWDCFLAGRQIEIYERSMALAQQQLDETGERIKVGQLPGIELAAARSEVALRQEALINARSALASARLKLLRLVSPPGEGFWSREVRFEESPVLPGAPLGDVEEHVRVALRQRPDANQARLQVQRGDLEVVKTKNGLLPRLDLFLNLGKSGYSDSFGGADDFFGEGYDLQAGLKVSFPFRNREAQAAERRAFLSRSQAAEAVENLAQLIQLDVRSAYIEVERLREQIVATAASRGLQEEKLRAETEKFRVGRSTSFMVAQAQRDLLNSQISEVHALTSCLKALVELYRLEGTLLERRGIEAPGRDPAGLPPGS